MTPAASLSVVVTNYNGEHYLPAMMAALDATGFPFLEIIVSDDASTDGSRVLLRHRFPQVTVVTSNENLGPAAARNLGINATRGDLVLLLDNDGHPFPDAVPPMLAALAADADVVAVMPRIVLGGDHAVVHCDGARTHVTGQMWLLNGHLPLATAPSAPEEIASLMGTAMLFRRADALAIGGFEPDYFFYYEDHDFGTRMRILRGRLRSVPEARIDHLTGTKDLSFRVGSPYPTRRAYLTAKNRVLFVLRTLEGRTLSALAPLLVLHEIAQAAFAIFRGWADAYAGGLAWNLSHLGRTLRKRDRIQAQRIVHDRAILQDGALPLHPGIMKATGPAASARRGLERCLNALYRLLRPLLR